MSTVEPPTAGSENALGKRVSKQTVRTYETANIHVREKKALVIANGNGEKLGSINYFTSMLSKLKGDHDLLKAFHRLLYGSIGDNVKRKSNIKNFSGFGDADNETAMANRKGKLATAKVWTMPALKELSTLLGQEKSGTKEQVVDRIMNFLSSPSKEKMTKVLADKDALKKKKQETAAKKKAKVAKGKGKIKKNKDGKIKTPKPITGYMLFSMETRPKIVASNPGLSFGETARLISSEWKKLSETEQQAYKDRKVMPKEKEVKVKATKSKASAPKKVKNEKEKVAEEEDEDDIYIEDEEDDDEDEIEDDEIDMEED